MKALWARFDEAREREPLPGSSQNAELSGAAIEWLRDRLVQDDMLEALGEVLPAAPPEVLLSIAGTVGRVVNQP